MRIAVNTRFSRAIVLNTFIPVLPSKRVTWPGMPNWITLGNQLNGIRVFDPTLHENLQKMSRRA